ncbi:MAG TPA: AsmA family protein, partial [Steroidobacteraceae bacterium]
MRLLKIVGIGIGTVVALVIVLVIAVALFVHPNAYRGRIERMVQQSTGRSLQLSGDLHLALLPSIALRLGPASLGNPPGFPVTPFMTLRQASLHVKLLPLLHGQLQIGHIDIEGLNAQLLRNAQGQGNWEGLGSSSNAPASGPASTRPPAAPAAASPPAALPQIAGLTLRNARISYEGSVLEPLNLTVGRVAEGVAVPVSVQMQLQRSTGAPIALSGSLAVTYEPDALRVSAIDLHLDQSHVSGELALAGSGTEAVSFNLQIDRLDLDHYRSNPPKAAAPAAAQVSTPLQLPAAMLKSLQMHGSLLVGTLKLSGITMTQVQLQALARDGVTHLSPLAAQLYGGTYRGELTLDVRSSVPLVTTQQTLAGVDLARLLKDFEGTQRLSGSANLTARLRGQ